MALKYWFPMTDGTIKNNGTNGDQFTSNAFSLQTNGKLGKCIKTLSTSSISGGTTAQDWVSARGVSFAGWFYFPESEIKSVVNASSSSYTVPTGTLIGYNSYGGAALTWSAEKPYVNGGFGVYGTIRTSDGGLQAGGGSITSYLDKWVHLATTIDFVNKKIQFYINGSPINAGTSCNAHNLTPQPIAMNASQIYGGNGPGLSIPYYCNDVRVYDEPISPREVAEIAKGLVLHYPLAMPGQENLTPCGGIYTQSNPRTTTSSKTDGGVWIPNSAFEGTPSTTYTISVQCDGTLSNAHGIGGLSPADKPWSFWLYICNTDTSKSWQTGSYDTPINLNSSNHNYRKIGNTHVWTYTLSSTQKYISLRTNSYSDGTTNVTVNWWNIKVEKGDTFTPWIPSTSSELYTALGLNDGIEYDVSGYGNNGTIVGTFSCSGDTPRYGVSTVLPNSCATYIKATGLKQQIFTWSCWFKIVGQGASSSQRILSEGRDTGSRGVEIWTSKDGLTLYCFAHNLKSNTTIALNTWYHVAVVCDGTSSKFYLNGTQFYTGTYSADVDYAQSSDAFVIGKMAYSYTNTSNYFPLNGQVSDVRIYATALTADQVKELYNAPISLANNGTLMAYEFNEI